MYYREKNYAKFKFCDYFSEKQNTKVWIFELPQNATSFLQKCRHC